LIGSVILGNGIDVISTEKPLWKYGSRLSRGMTGKKSRLKDHDKKLMTVMQRRTVFLQNPRFR
jgi:hypothetical protein